jgi:D-sedoheptulose 7-phosphate isomerase
MMSNRTRTDTVFARAIAEHLEVIGQIQSRQPDLESIAQAMSAALRRGGKVLWCGNGGSAADSQHLAAEMVGRFRRERRALPSIALTTDTSILTAVANDYGYEAVFARQVEALGNEGDLLVAMSTSGNSQNVICALTAARARGMVTVALTGAGGGRMATLADHLFAVESRDTARIQEAHILAGHMLCDWVEQDSLQAEPQGKDAAGPERAEVSR